MGICLKRTLAFMFDMVFVVFIILLLLLTPLNIKTNKYYRLEKKCETIRSEYVNVIMMMQEKFDDNKLTKSEVNTIVKKYPGSKKYFKNYSGAIEENDYNKLIMDISTDYNKRYINKSYQLERENTGKYLISFIIAIIYFILIPYILKGQTLGYKLFDLKFVNNKGKRVNLAGIVLRALTVNGILFLILNYALLYLNSYNAFTKTMKILAMLYVLFLITCAITLIRDEKNIGLHDKLCHMKVKEV